MDFLGHSDFRNLDSACEFNFGSGVGVGSGGPTNYLVPPNYSQVTPIYLFLFHLVWTK
jgi:hypothetical protein